MRSAHYALAWLGLSLAACGSGASPRAMGGAAGASTAGAAGAPIGAAGASDEAGAAGTSDEAPTLSSTELAALAELSPGTLPSPPLDKSNRFADDPKAAAFGQELFFEPRFSGKLLDGDDDGSPSTLGH
ncbi:MAG TPA: hypothetical protein VGL19_07370, partial [Polyangiaceae bacterium]